MTWYNSLAETERASLSSGLTNPNQVDNTLNAWDLQKINYDAPGGDGWVNDLTGMFQSLNPFAIAQTYGSIYDQQAKDNPDDNMFNNTWNAIWGTAAAGVGNFFNGSNHMLLRPAVSGVLTAAAGVRAADNALSGEDSTWDEDINSAWDLSKSGKIGLGDAVSYTTEQAGKIADRAIGRDDGAAALGTKGERPDQKKFDKDGNGVLSDEERVAYQGALHNWGINSLSDDFDIFDQSQREAAYNSSGTLSSSTPTQLLNFAGEMILNPLNFIPGGAILGKVNVARRGLSEASNIGNTIERELLELSKSADGATSAASRNLQFFAKNNADTIGQSRFAKDIAGDKRDVWTSLMGTVDNEADAAKVEMAMFYGSKKSFTDLYRKYGNDPEFAFTLDSTKGGGYFARKAADPTSTVMATGVDDSAEIGRLVDTILDRPEYSDFARVLKQGAVDIAPDGSPQLVANGLRTTTLKNGKLFGLSDNLIDFTGAHIRNWNRLGEGTPAALVSLYSRAPKVMSIVRRGGITAARDIIQTDGNVNQTEKFIGYVDDVFHHTRPRTGKIGAEQAADEQAVRNQFVDSWRNAASTADRFNLLAKVEDYGWGRLGSKYGIDAGVTRNVSANLRQRNGQLMKSIRNSDRNRAVVIDGDNSGVVYHDPIVGASTGEQAYLVDWSKADKYLTSRGSTNLQKAALQIEADALKVEPVHVDGRAGGVGAAAYNTATAVSGVVNEFQALWSAVTLTRIARLTREPITTLAPLAIIGKLPAMIKESGDYFGQITSKISRDADRVMNRGRTLSSVYNETSEVGRMAAEVQQNLDLLTSLARSPENLTLQQRVALEAANIQTAGKDFLYHGQITKLPRNLDFKRPMSFSASEADAESYVAQHGLVPSIDFNPKLARAAESARQAWLKAGVNTRETEGYYKAAQQEFLAAQKAEGDRASLAEVSRLLEENQAKLASASPEDLPSIQDAIQFAEKMQADIVGSIGDAPQLAQATAKVDTLRGLFESAGKAEAKAARNHANALKAHQSADDAGLEGLHTKLREEIAAGKTVKIRVKYNPDGSAGKNFKKQTIEQIEELGARIGNYDIKVLGKGEQPGVGGHMIYGATVKIPTGGKMPQELRSVLGLSDAKQVNGWIKREGWRDEGSPFVKWAEDNNVGKFVFTQNGRETYVAIPKFIESKTHNPVGALAQERVQRQLDAALIESRAKAAARGLSPEQEIRRKQVRALFEGEPQSYEAYLAKVDQLTYTQAKLKARMANLNAEITQREARIKVDPRTDPKNKLVVDGQRFDKFDSYGEGQRFADLNSSEGAAQTLVGSGLEDVTLGKQTLRELKPFGKDASPDYHKGWAGVLETEYKNDTPFRYIVANDDEGLNKFLDSAAGKQLLKDKGVGQKESSIDHIVTHGGSGLTREQYVEELRDLADTLFPQGTQELRQKFLDGDVITESYLARTYADNPNLKTLTGYLFKEERESGAYGIAQSVKKAQKTFLDYMVAKPQNILANMPFAKVAYKEALERSIAAHRLQNGERVLTQGEHNSMVLQARRSALQETKKWIYNVTDRSNFEESAAYFSRFISAYMFSVRQAKNIVTEYPLQAAWVANGIGGIPGAVPMYDKNGDRTKDFNKASKIVVPLEPWMTKELTKIPVLGDWIKDADLDKTNQIRLSRASVDPWFGGDYLPGAGPLVSIPLNIIGKVSPEGLSTVNDMTKFIPAITGDDRGLIDFLQPYGINQGGAAEQVLPAYAVAGLTALTNGDPNSQGVGHAMYNQTLAETTLAVMSDYEEHPENYDHKPTHEEIEKKTKSLFWLKSFSSFTLPTSVTPSTDWDIAAEAWKRYKKAGGTAYGFAKEHPELAYAETNILSGRYNIPSSDKSVMALRDNPELPEWAVNNGGAAEDLMSWALGATDADYVDYDKGASGWLANNGPGDGTTYSTPLTPQQAIEKENTSRGWSEYWRRVGLINGYAAQNNIVVENSPVLKQYKKQLIQQMVDDPKYKDWRNAYNVRDGGTYDKRADALEELYASDWYGKNSTRKDVQTMRQYLDARTQVKADLDARQQQGGSADLNSDSNVDLHDAFYAQVQQMVNSNVNFGDVYEQRFSNEDIKG